MNENTTGAPLTATVGERLGGDPHMREVQEQVAEGAGRAAGARGEPGEHPEAASRRPRAPGQRPRGGGGPARPFPWGALALAVVGWALLTGIGRGVRRRARALGEGAVGLAHRLQPR